MLELWVERGTPSLLLLPGPLWLGVVAPDVNAHKTEYMCYNQTGDISTLDGTPLKLVDKFTYLGRGRLINRKGHQHEVTEGMDSYQ